jgi:hypothetical protein
MPLNGPHSRRFFHVSEPHTKPKEGIWPYLGVGCITVVSGFFGGGMIAILVAKVIGAVRSCTPEADTGAPCGWFNYMAVGACVGAVFLPTVAIWRMRRGRMKPRDKA